ncbi:MAG: glycoside hydrolase family 16 protein [Bacteroidota bacterium]
MKQELIKLASLMIILISVSCSEKKEKSTTEDLPATNNEAQLVWGDEFNYEGLPKSDLWDYDRGDGCENPGGCGWGNQERQYYTYKELKNGRVEDGHLIIEAHKQKIGQADYSSVRLVSKPSGIMKYGRIEVRAKLPSGRGTWPAIWLLPVENKYGGWPRSGEIDIMEHVGYNPDSLFATVHTESYNHMLGTQKDGEAFVPTAESDFHIYTLNWQEDKMEFFVDDNNYFTYFNDGSGPASWPFDQEFYLILNIAVGGSWGGALGIDEDVWPQRMEVDYVRYYQ